MKSSLLFVCFVLLSIGSFAQSKLNLGFEDLEKGLPKNWETLGSEKYKVLVDSLNKVSGKYSLAFEGNGTSSDFKALYISLPANYDGKEMRLSGFIKSKGINDGSAGLYIRVDPNLAFDNMESRAVKGSVDWTKFEITVPLSPKETSTITVGVYLIGSGKVWFDDLNITVDDKELDQAKVFEKEIMPAELDKEFDEGSKISFTSLDNNKVNDLELLGKIWGFVKYHHPEVAKGKYNWDYELFRVLPTYLEAKNLSSRNDILATWLARFGTVAPCGSCTNNKDVAHQSDFSWMENSELSASVKGKLNEILVGRNQGEHYYIALHKNIGNPDFKNEKAYASMPYPDAGFRLLALYKYWNMIEYFFPYKYQTDKKWNAVLKEYVPVFLNAKDELEYELAVLKIIGDIKDTHANLWGGGNKISQLRGKNYAPFRVGFSESKLVVTDIYNPELLEADEIKIGDVITHINGKDVTAIVDSLKTFYPASNEAAQLRDISLELLRSAESNIQLEYVSGDKTQQKRKVKNVPLV